MRILKFVMALLIYIIFANMPSILTAQGDYGCYRISVDKGLQSMRKGDYVLAIRQFNVAYNCDYSAGEDSLKLLIENSANELNQAKVKAQNAERLALENERKALWEKDEKEKALNEKESALREVEKQGRQVESMLLLLLSDKLRLGGQVEEALVAAYASLKYGQPGIHDSGMKAFGSAVKDSLSQTIFESKSSVEKLVPLSVVKKLMIIAENETAIADYVGNESPVIFNPSFGHANNHCISPVKNQLFFWNAAQGQLWHPEGTLLQSFNDHTKDIRFATFSNDDQWLVTCSRDHTAILRNLSNNTTTILTGHTSPVYEAKFSSDNRYLLTRSAKGVVVIWSLDGKQVARLGGDDFHIYDAAFNSTNNRVVCATADGKIVIRPLNSSPEKVVNAHQKAVREILFFANDDHFVSRSTVNVKGWDPAGNPLANDFYEKEIKGMKMDHQKSKLLLWGPNRYATLVDLKKGTRQHFVGLESDVDRALFSPNDEYLLLTSKNETATLWDVSGQLLIHWSSIDQHPLNACFSHDGSHFSVLSDNRMRVLHCPVPPHFLKQIDKAPGLWNNKIRRLFDREGLRFLNN